jgi:hypothetical protein
MTARCKACGQQWPCDPALEVECPDCHARPGAKCRRPSGHACDIHAARDRLAMARGFLTPCPATSYSDAAGLHEDDTPALQFSLSERIAPPCGNGWMVQVFA